MIDTRQRAARDVGYACLCAVCLVFACVGDEGTPTGGSSSDASAATSTTAIPDEGEPTTSRGSADSGTGSASEPSTSSSGSLAESDTIAAPGEPECEIPTPLDLPPGSICAAQEVVQAYQPGMVAHGELGLLDVVLVQAEPGPPVEGFNGWTLLVRDVASCTPQPGIALSVVPFMPMHGHGTPTLPHITDHGDGTYAVESLNLWMGGYWRIRVGLESVELGKDETAFHICIE